MILNKQPYNQKSTGALTQGTSTEYTLLNEITFRKNRWVRSGNSVWVKCTFTCNTVSSTYKQLSTNLPTPYNAMDGTSCGICFDDIGEDTTCRYLIQNGVLYIKGGIAGHSYIVDHAYVADF